MVSRLERWAEDARVAGYLDEADVIEIQAKVFTKAGVPKDFPYTGEELREIKEFRAGLIDVFSTKRFEPGKRLNAGLAEEFNQKAGRYLGDKVKIRDLDMHFEGVEQVDIKFRRAYSCILNSFKRARYQTLGEIRDTADLRLLHSTSSIGMPSIVFFKTAFARPQAEKH